MPISVRLTTREQEKLREKCIQINKILIKMEKSPLKDSELVHAILEQAIDRVEVSRDGDVFIPD